MVNTRILTREFDYHRPDSLEEAFELLAEYGGAAKVIAGGTDVVPQLKYEKIAPNHLITLMKISGLSDITEENGGLSIGACARLRVRPRLACRSLQDSRRRKPAADSGCHHARG